MKEVSNVSQRHAFRCLVEGCGRELIDPDRVRLIARAIEHMKLTHPELYISLSRRTLRLILDRIDIGPADDLPSPTEASTYSARCPSCGWLLRWDDPEGLCPSCAPAHT